MAQDDVMKKTLLSGKRRIRRQRALDIIVERIGCRLVKLGQSFSLFIKTGRDRRTIHQDKWWSSQKQKYQEPRFRNHGARPFQDALEKLRVASYFYRYYFSVVHIDVKYSFDLLFFDLVKIANNKADCKSHQKKIMLF